MLTAFSCKKSEINCSPVSLKTIDLSDPAYIPLLGSRVEDRFLVINSKSEFLELAEKPVKEEVNIDFKQYTLFVGKKRLTAINGTLMSQNVARDCDANKYIYHVQIKNGGYTALGNFVFGALIPKVQNSGRVDFNVEVID
ncbi:MAG TPA: hypothetical protein VEV16_07335 [Daejeonella sp.]|nr:hypothetical protein [Daejeonella sp.]